MECVNNHIPLRKKTKKEEKFAYKPWISNSIKRSIQENCLAKFTKSFLKKKWR